MSYVSENGIVDTGDDNDALFVIDYTEDMKRIREEQIMYYRDQFVKDVKKISDNIINQVIRLPVEIAIA